MGERREQPPIENTSAWVDRVRLALDDNPSALEAFEKILGEFRLTADEQRKLRYCPREDCAEHLVEVKCWAGHTSRGL